jgi:site-specific recombinase XerD
MMNQRDGEENIVVVEQSGALGPSIDSAHVNPALLYVASLMEGQSRKTGIESLRRLARLLRWSDWRTAPWERLSARETTYVRAALIRDYSPAAARLTLSMLKGVLKQAFRVGLMDADTYQRAVLLPPIKQQSAPAGRMLTEAEMASLAAHIVALESPRGPMASALFAVALGGGLRREELAVLQATALAADGTHLLVQGKGARERVQALPPWVGEAVQRWLTLRETLGLTSASMFVQVSRRGQLRDKPLTIRGVWQFINDTMRASGSAHFTPHDLRRTFASRMMELADLKIVQNLMGHANMNTTARYDRRGAQVAAQAVGELTSCGFSKEEPPVKKTITIPPVAPKGLATIGEALRVKPSLTQVQTLGAERERPLEGGTVATRPATRGRPLSDSFVAPPGAPLERGAPEETSQTYARGLGTWSTAAIVASKPPREGAIAHEKRVTVEVQKSNVIQLHPETGQRLVNRRQVVKPDYLRDGKPLDVGWVRRQVKALVARELGPQKIVEVLTRAGVRRGDGSKVWIDDVTRWST